jgi:glycerate kinase
MGQGFSRVFPDAEIVELPIADGGEYTVEVLRHYLGGETRQATVTGPLGEPVTAQWAIAADGVTALVQVSAASGIGLLRREQLNPLITSTYGTGELIREALRAGCTKIILALGGSATVDGGAGCLQALGANLISEDGGPIDRGGGGLGDLAHIDLSGLDPMVRQAQFELICDVDNPTTGPEGAAMVFGPQKGATPEMARLLDGNLKHFAEVIKADLGPDVMKVRHGGAAGGISAGLHGVLGAHLAEGTALIFDLIGFAKRIAGCELVVTAEGRLDRQTLHGKAPYGVAMAARAAGAAVIALPGQVEPEAKQALGEVFDAILPIVDKPMALDEAIGDTARLLGEAAERAGRLMVVGGRFSN